MNNVSFNPGMTSVNFQAKTDKVDKANDVSYLTIVDPSIMKDLPDSFELQGKNNGAELSKEDKQEILQKAKTKAAGWSVFGEGFSTLYYGLRSDKTIAKKYDLDEKADKAFIKQIKREQVKSTLPGFIFPGGGGVISWIYNKNRDASELEVK